jgi:glutathione S-transferase
MNHKLTFFHAPNSRSAGVRVLLEELGAHYDVRVLDLSKKEQRQPEFLAINPMGKVPAIRHGEALVTEQPAIYIYLADLHHEAGLAPALRDPQRGPYLRWMAFYGSAFEPAMVDRMLQREPADRSTSPYGGYDDVIGTLTSQLRAGPYLLGDRFSAADVLWGTALGWITAFKLVPELPEIVDYVARVASRPAAQRAASLDAGIAAAQARIT